MKMTKQAVYMLFENVDDEAELLWIQSHQDQIRELSICVTQGDVNQMEELIRAESHNSYGNFAPSALRNTKNLVIILTHNLKTAALLGGMNTAACSRMEEAYVRKIESCESVGEVQALADVVKRTFCRGVYEQNIPRVADIKIKKAVRYIADHYTKKLSIQEIADAVKLSREYLSTKFHLETGMTITQFIQRERIRTAKWMLMQTDVSLSELSALLGFSSQSYFITQFKKETGMTPAQYRRQTAGRAQPPTPHPPRS